ncbi:MAG: HAD-IIA family hydrolase [Solirubrobacterales bacterium]|nr:HAD-IIA family hydrolase [Solirubrobacterales bacterium]
MSEGPARAPDRVYCAYVFDLDGTVYLGDELLPGAKRLIEGLRAGGRAVRFVSNNATQDPEQYADKLSGLGLETSVEEVVSSIVVTTRWLLDNAPDAVVFAIGEEPLQRALGEAGIRMSSDPAEIDVVIASYDRSFHYRKLQIAFDAIWFHRRARLIATNPDRFCPLPDGRGEPDCAAITAAIEACTGARAEQVLGKPSSAVLDAALDGLGLDAEDCMMVGDRLSTDIRMGLDAGMATALVLTGDTKLDDLEQSDPHDRPHFVVQRIDELVPEGLWAELDPERSGAA